MALDEKNDDKLSEADSDPTAKYVNTLFKRWMKGCRKQHRNFEEADKFVMGNQWAPEDVAKLNAENRPVAVFNYTKRHINVVSGVQILNNLQPQFVARVIESEQALVFAEMATGAHDFVMQACDGYFEVAEAFRDLTVRGLSFMKERLDLIAEPGGQIIWERVDGRHVVWDTDARKQNLEDAKGFIFFARIAKQEAANEWPAEKDYIMSSDASDFDDVFGTSAKVEQVVPPVYDPANKYETDAIDAADRHSIILKEAYWYEDEDWYEYIDPFTPDGGVQEMASGKFRKFKREYEQMFPERPEVEGAQRKKRVYKRAFVIGRRTMEESDAPCQVRFPLLPMTAEWDAEQKVYVGLPGVLKDPQQFLNKYLSQTMHAIATSPKGILMFEDGAFDNILMAEEQWASWAPFIPMSAGALGGPGGQGKRFEYIPPAQPPQIMFEMWKACIEVIGQISGISQEMLTGGEGEVPGITMRQRQNVAMIAMAGYFNAYRRFLKAEAIVTFNQVQKFYADDRIIRIGGPYDGQAVRLSDWRDQLAVKYDVIIDENPRNPNTADQHWETLVQSGILPGLFKTGAIMQMPSLIDVFPLFPKAKGEMKAWVMKMNQNLSPGQIPGQKQPAQKQQSARDNPQVIQANIAHKQAQTQLTQGKYLETLAKAKELDAKTQAHKLQATLDVFAQSYEQQQKAREHALNSRKTHHDMLMNSLSAMGDMSGVNEAGA